MAPQLSDALPRFRPALLALVLLGTAGYSYVLAFHYDWLQQIPGWFFYYQDKHKVAYQFAHLAWMLAFGLLTGFIFLKKSPRALVSLGFGLALFVSLQIGYGWVLGGGFEALREKYATAAISEELQTVCQSSQDLRASLQDYDQLYGQDFWLGTKPPGFFAFYALTRAGMGLLRPAVLTDPRVCFLTLTKNFAYLLPFLAALTLVPLYFVQKQLLGRAFPFLSGLVYLAVPSVLLMTLLPDQFLFPLLFCLFLLALTWMVTRQSFAAACLAGALACFSIFVSFSLLPILGLTLLWLGLDAWIQRRSLKRLIGLLAAFAAGLLLVSLLLWLWIGYNPLLRYQLAFQQHRAIKQFDFSLPSLMADLLLNQLDFMLWTGFGLLCLFYLGAFNSFKALFRGQAGTFDSFRVAFFLTFLILNLAGQTRSEVGRLWVFLLPGLALVSFPETLKLLKNPFQSFALYFISQLWSASLVFYYIHFP